MTMLLFTCVILLRWQSDTEMAKYKEAGGIIQWSDRAKGQLLIRQYEKGGNVTAVSTLQPLMEVNTVILYGYGFQDIDVKAISNWTHLRAVSIVYCTDVTDHGIKALTRCSQLRFLSIWDTSVKGECLGTLGKLTQLRELDIQNCSIGDIQLASLKTWAQLRKLYLLNTRVTSFMTEELKKSLPLCEVEWEE
jgi:hypothetical protein